MSGLVSFNMKIPASDKEELTRLAEELGIPAVTIVKFKSYLANFKWKRSVNLSSHLRLPHRHRRAIP